jgi:hypothetical protein
MLSALLRAKGRTATLLLSFAHRGTVVKSMKRNVISSLDPYFRN